MNTRVRGMANRCRSSSTCGQKAGYCVGVISAAVAMARVTCSDSRNTTATKVATSVSAISIVVSSYSRRAAKRLTSRPRAAARAGRSCAWRQASRRLSSPGEANGCTYVVDSSLVAAELLERVVDVAVVHDGSDVHGLRDEPQASERLDVVGQARRVRVAVGVEPHGHGLGEYRRRGAGGLGEDSNDLVLVPVLEEGVVVDAQPANVGDHPAPRGVGLVHDEGHPVQDRGALEVGVDLVGPLPVDGQPL